MVLIIDSQVAGISGDMLLCGLVDLGASRRRVIDAIRAAAESWTGSRIRRLSFEKVARRGQGATAMILEADEQEDHGRAAQMLERVSETLGRINASPDARSFAESSMRRLVSAESAVHDVPAGSAILHETFSLDTVADIVGTAVALDDLGLYGHRFFATPVAVGAGTITFSHGRTSNPAGAILEILRGTNITISGTPVDAELATPTGAAMLASLAPECGAFYPPIMITGVGYGAGARDHADFANVLKLVTGRRSVAHTGDSVKILETNVDDISGEVVGHVIGRLYEHGALDVTVTAAIGKKGRPASIFCVICEQERVESLLDVLMAETGTLGVRIRNSRRITVPRSIQRARVEILGKSFEVRYKDAGGSGFKIEYDDIRSVSESVGRPLRETESMIRRQIHGSRGD